MFSDTLLTNCLLNYPDAGERVYSALARLAHMTFRINESLLDAHHSPTSLDAHQSITHVLVQCMLSTLPLCYQLFNMFGTDDRKMEKLCKMWKFAIRSTKSAFQPHLTSFINIILQVYQVHQLSYVLAQYQCHWYEFKLIY